MAPAINIERIVAEAVQAERAKIKAILTCPEAVGREWAARTIAFGGGFDVPYARKTLAGMRTDAETTDAEIDACAREIAAKYGRPRGRSS